MIALRFESCNNCCSGRSPNLTERPGRFSRDFVFRAERRAQISDCGRVVQKSQRVGGVPSDARVAIRKQAP